DMQPQPPDPGTDDRAASPPAGPDDSLLPRQLASWRPAEAPQPPAPPQAAPWPGVSAPDPTAPSWPDAPPQPWQQPAQGYQTQGHQTQGHQPQGHQAPGRQPPDQPPRRQPPGAPQADALAPGGRSARDDTTRYLCAAAQLSSDFSNAAISEYLVEPTRPVPPSPGFDVAVVLNEAVAARARRIVRDTVLLIVAVLLLVIAPPILLLLWVMAAGALLWMFSSGRRL